LTHTNRFLSLPLLALGPLCPQPSARAAEPPAGRLVPPGPGSFVFEDEKGNRDRPIKVWTWRPERFGPRSPILIVMHGNGRDGRAYRDSWTRRAREAGALLLVPEFSEKHYPGSKWYQLGNLRGSAHVGPPDVLDWSKLRRLLLSGAGPGGPRGLKRAWSRLAPDRAAKLKAALRPEKPGAENKGRILAALNELVEDEELYGKESFPKPPAEARRILEWHEQQKKADGQKELRGSALRRLNRSLLAQSLPGCLRAADYSDRKRSKWTYLAVEHLFDHVLRKTGSKRTGYLLYGHSAGAQFVHRMMLLLPKSRAERAVAANAGKYLWPDLAVDYPYGLGGVAGRRDRLLREALGRKLVIMPGTEDTEEDETKDPDLPTSEGAMKQGKNRLERARNFHKAAGRAARKLGVRLNWELREVKGVAHRNSGMVPEAADVLLGAAK
jgi:hypothetical protein